MTLRLAAICALTCAAVYLTGYVPQDDATSGPPEGVEVQARGPVHEAYGEATNLRGTPGPVVSQQPPAPIEESPPEEKPEGDNVSWIPGYWFWDEQGNEFIWVSGFWREEPPGRDWVPGEWHKVEGGYQWVSGYWALEGQEEEEYLPPPPESLDQGPAVPAPGPNYVYNPGTWIFQTSRYLWQPGYWVAYRPGWVWTPACYRWTPAGYVFVRGYWDRPLTERGLLFAPVRFTRKVFLQRDFVYRPSYVIQPDALVSSLFVRADTRHYYFGDYFEPDLRKKYVPWVDYRVNRTNLDVNYAYFRAAYAKHTDWERNLRTLYTARYEKEIARPPRTLVQQQKVINNITVNKTANQVVNRNVNITNVQNLTVLQPVNKVKTLHPATLASLANVRPAEAKTAPVHREVRIERVRKEHVQEEKKQIERYRAIAKERQSREMKLATPRTEVPKMTAPVRVKKELPKTAPPPRVRKKVEVPSPPAMPKAGPHLPKGPPPVPKKDRTKDKG